jgi:transmembrane protein EpsG
MKLFQLFSGSYQLFLLAVAVFFMSMMAIWIYKNSASPCTSYLLFSTLFYSYETLTRQNIAIALLVFLGYDLIIKRKFWKFMSISLAAFLIHKSSLVFVPMYFLTRLPVSLGYMIFWAVAAAVVTLLGKRFYGPIALWIGYDKSQVEYTVGGAEQYAALLVLLCIIIWILYPWIRRHRKDAPLLFHINVMTLITGLLAIQHQGFMRIQV